MHPLFPSVDEAHVDVTEVMLRELAWQALEPYDRRRARRTKARDDA